MITGVFTTLMDVCQNFITIQVRKFYIEDDQIRLEPHVVGEPRVPVAGADRAKFLALEIAPKDIDDIGFVFGDKYKCVVHFRWITFIRSYVQARRASRQCAPNELHETYTNPARIVHRQYIPLNFAGGAQPTGARSRHLHLAAGINHA